MTSLIARTNWLSKHDVPTDQEDSIRDVSQITKFRRYHTVISREALYATEVWYLTKNYRQKTDFFFAKIKRLLP